VPTPTPPDHGAGDGELARRFGVSPERGGPGVQVIETPGHADDHLTFVVEGLCFSGDLLFRDAVGGGEGKSNRMSLIRIVKTAAGAFLPLKNIIPFAEFRPDTVFAFIAFGT